MTYPSQRRRIAKRGASATAIVVLLAAGAFGALASSASARAVTTSVDTTYLQDTLGLPVSTVVETVTYDRFQWLLQQPGQFAFVVGSKADAGFPAKVVAADAAAKTAGAAKIYWFDPNLTGIATPAQNLNTRVPSGINLAAGSQTTFGNIWKNVLGQYLGNGIKSVPNAAATIVTVTNDDTIINDADNPAWDYRTGQTAAVSATDDVFFIYDKDHTAAGSPDKIVSWVNLTTNADVPTAIGTAFTAAGGGAVIDQIGQFEWWKSAANRKHDLAYTDDARYGGDVLSDADNTNGWHIQQVTYPELLHLLDVKADGKNFVILFGGTWCHNTRAVLSDINREAHENGDTTVYNFDLVVDGGNVNGTNGNGLGNLPNPIHVRDNANNGTTFNYRPSWVYGDVVRKYFNNLTTEYDANTKTRVSFYPAGDLGAFPDVVRKLQVPFLINYQRGTGGSPSGTSVKRQWIQQNADPSTGLATFKEYMSEWWFTHPSAQLGLSTTPTQGERDQAAANAAFGAEAVAKLKWFFGGLPGAVATSQTLTAPSVSSATVPTVTLTIDNTFGRTPTGTATLAVNGLNYPVALSANKAVFTLPKLPVGTYPLTVTYATDAQIVGFASTGNLVITATAPPVTGYSAPEPQKASRAIEHTVTVTVTATPIPSPEPSPSATPSASPSPSPSAEPSPSASATPSPTASPTVEALGASDQGSSGQSGWFTLLAIVGGTLGVGGLAFGGYIVFRGR